MQKLPELKIDFDAEIDRYRDFAEKIRPLVVDSVSWLTSKLKFFRFIECIRKPESIAKTIL